MSDKPPYIPCPMTNVEAQLLRDLAQIQTKLATEHPHGEFFMPDPELDVVNDWYAAMLTYAATGQRLPPTHWMRARQDEEIAAMATSFTMPPQDDQHT